MPISSPSGELSIVQLFTSVSPQLGRNLVGVEQLERFANEQWTAAHLSDEQAAASELDSFRRHHWRAFCYPIHLLLADISSQASAIEKFNSPDLGKEFRMIRKLKSGQYRLYSRKVNPRTHQRRNLGTFTTRTAAEKHEKEIQYFKRH